MGKLAFRLGETLFSDIAGGRKKDAKREPKSQNLPPKRVSKRRSFSFAFLERLWCHFWISGVDFGVIFEATL